MAANIRYRGTFYNTPNAGSPASTQKIEILDTESVAGVTAIQITQVDISFEGLTVDLKPGVFPTSVRFGLYLRTTPEVAFGVTYGVSYGIF